MKKKHIGYVIEGSGQDLTLPFRVFYVMQNVEGTLTKLGYTNNIERRRQELSIQYQTEMVVVYDGTPLNGKAPATVAKEIERAAKNELSRKGYNGYLVDRYGEAGFEWFHNVPNEVLAELICQAENAASQKVKLHEFGTFAPPQKTKSVIENGIKLVQETAAEEGKLYYGVAQHGTWARGRVNKKYSGQPKDWNGDLGKSVAIKGQRIHIRFSATKTPSVCKVKKATSRTALHKMTV